MLALLASLLVCAQWGDTRPAPRPGNGPVKAAENPQPFNVEPRRPVARDISPEQTHTYQIGLGAGQYAHITVECWGADVRAVVRDPSNRAGAESECRRRDPSPLSILAADSGVYTLEVSAPGGGPAGGYRLTLEELRRATVRDRSRVLAEQAFTQAERLRGRRLMQAGREAIRAYEAARDYWAAAGDARASASALRRIGQVHQSLDEPQEALDFYNRALALGRKSGGEREQGDVLNNIARLQVDRGDNQQALRSVERALRLSRSAGNGAGEAESLSILGDVYYNFGDIRKALGYYTRSLQLWQQLNDYQGQAEVLVSFGYAYVETSDIAAARDSYQRALALSRAAGDRRLEAVALRALGNLQTKLGESQQSFNLFHQALRILDDIDDRHLKATVLGGLAYSYECVGEKRFALNYYEQALAVFKEIRHPWGEAEAEMPIGEIYYSLGENEQALAHYRAALAIFRAQKITRWEAMTLRNVGLVYDALGDTEKALSYYRQSLALTHAGQDQRYEAYTLNYIGRVHEKSGRARQALTYYGRALALNRVALDSSGESLSLYNIARVERDAGRLDEARARVEEAIGIAESLRTKVASLDLRAAYLASAHQYYELYVDVLMRLHDERPREDFAALAFAASERARARSLIDSLKEAWADIRQGVDPSLLEQERSLRQLLDGKAERQAALLAGRRNDEAQALALEVAQLTARYDEVKALIKSQSPHYAGLTQPRTLNLREVQQQVLDDDTLLLEYSLGDDRSYVWAVTANGADSFRLAGRAEIEAAARRVYALLTAAQPVPGESFSARQGRAAQARAQLPSEIASLSRLVLEPVAARLGRRRLVVVTDGALQYIPFQVLTLPQSARAATGADAAAPVARAEPYVPLIVEHEVVNEPSASTLAQLGSEAAQRKPAPKTVAIFADPVFESDDPRIRPGAEPGAAGEPEPRGDDARAAFRDAGFSAARQLPRLMGSREEAEAIMALAPAGTGWEALGFAANRAAINSPELREYRIVHFATHGMFNNEYPELSGIILSLLDERGRPQDGFLKLHDVYNLSLSADLVVLSACNSGLGKDVRGEGLIGLTHGFMYAGASSVVASLWKVNDEATNQLMKHFYKFMLRDGLPPSAALRQAQLEMLKQRRWHEPENWAAFIIQGRYAGPGAVDYPRQGPVRYYAGAGIVTAGLGAFSFFAVRRRRRKRAPQTRR